MPAVRNRQIEVGGEQVHLQLQNAHLPPDDSHPLEFSVDLLANCVVAVVGSGRALAQARHWLK